MKILFISAWYPNRYDAMAGLFVRKHAEAVSLYNEVQVLYVHADTKIKDFDISIQHTNKLKQTIVYYPGKEGKYLGKTKKHLNYIFAYYKGWKLITASGFRPDIIHANILTRTGFIAWCIQLFTQTPYIIAEHWSRYLPIRNTYNGFVRKKITELVVKHASAVFPVSENLKASMLNHNLKNNNYFVVNNTVDSCFLDVYDVKKRSIKRILHVSCFDESAKNIKGILNAILALSRQRTDFEMVLVGTGINFDEIREYARQLNFPEGRVVFTGELTPAEVAEWIYNSDFFVLFSNYENSPVVVSESLYCGKPVISTQVGGISEHVNDSNGLLIAAKDEEALTKNMNYLLDHYPLFDAEKIRTEARAKFSMESVGKIITNHYNQIKNL
ncbi:MAG: glycosyltransferase [Paludibacter sp.]|nr:glycosyltransferase [Paludibacter sp.]